MSDYKSASEFSTRLTTTKLDCGKTLRELTDCDNITLWWFADFDLIDLLLHMPENPADYNPGELRFQDLLSRIPLRLFAGLNFIFDSLRKTIIKVALGVYRKSGTARTGEKHNPKVLFGSQDAMWRSVKDYDTQEIRKTDFFFDTLIKHFNEDRKVDLVATYPLIRYPYPFRAAWRSLAAFLSRLANWQIPYIPINLYWNRSMWKKEYEGARHFRKLWHTLSGDETFRRLCIFQGNDIFNIIQKQIRFYFHVLFPYVIKQIEMSRLMIETQKPDLLLLINEYGIFERALLIAAKFKAVPTLAVQHGNITASHQGYIYRKTDVSPAGSVLSPYCHLPDKMAVFGPYYKDLLVNTSAYPEDSIVVTGLPRNDVLNVLRQHCTREDVLKKYAVGSTKRVILWATQCIGLSDRENIHNFDAWRGALGELKDCVLVIKQHPREGRQYDRMIADNLNLPRTDVILVPKTADILPLIHACDVMVTKWSTTAVEAIALDKALIIMNLSDEPDKVDYVSKGVARGVYAEDDLALAIRGLIDYDHDMAEHREKFIEQYLYRIDGRATQRVARLICDMLRDSS